MIAKDAEIVHGKMITRKEASELYCVPLSTLTSRIYRGLSLEQAIDRFDTKKKRIEKGDRFGNLTATGLFLRDSKENRYNRKYEVICDCGNKIYCLGLTLKGQYKNSCNIEGCKYSSVILHNLSKTSEYKIWSGIKERCFDEKDTAYAYYGGIGVTMSDEFKDSFVKFYEHIGERPSNNHSIDRIDGTKGYERGNLRWATKKEQRNNQRRVNDLTLEIIRLKKLLDSNGIKY